MFNTLCRYSFRDFVKIPQKFIPLPMHVRNNATYFLIAKKKIPALWTELLTNENIKGFKTLYLNTKR